MILDRLRFAKVSLFLVAGGLLHIPGGAVAQTAQLPLAVLLSGQFTSAITTINGGFFNQNNAFVSSPDNPGPGQVGGGPWVRASGGTFNTTTFGSLVNGPSGVPLKVNSDYTGVQTGFDLGRYNIGASGYSFNVGLTGGYIGIGASGGGGPYSVDFDVPFVGGYAAFAGHGFFGDALIREDFLQANSNPGGLSASANATTVAGSLGYRYDVVNYFFVAPSAAISASWLEAANIAIPHTSESAAGIGREKGIDSQLGRFNVTVGKDFATQLMLLSPFFTAAVFHEFASPTHATFLDLDSQSPYDGQSFQGSTTRVGTFGQFSLGLNAKVVGTNMLTYVRGDVRTGDRVDGYAVSGGLRYQF